MKHLIALISLLVGILYLFLIRVDIDIENNTQLIIYSHIQQSTQFHLKTEADNFICNGHSITLDKKIATDYFYHGDREVSVQLLRGENHCHSAVLNDVLKIGQKITYSEFLILFLLLAVPVVYLLFFPFILLIDRIKLLLESKNNTNKHLTSSVNIADNGLLITKLIAFIILTGFLLRIVYFEKFGILSFQHDWQGHIDFILYMAQNWDLPIPSQGWEYPQQPLYYLISAGLYSLFVQMGLTSNEAVYSLGYISLVYSFIFLIYSYRFLCLLISNQWVLAAAMAFLALTPSIVFISARINNDSLVIMLSAMSLFYIVRSYLTDFKQGFVSAIICTSLLFLTKVSAASVELLFFVLLIIVYYRSNNALDKLKNKQNLLVFSLLGLFLLSFTLLRVYIPLENSFHMVNGAAFPGQELKLPYVEYFSSFNIKELIRSGQSYVFGNDMIRHSFITYQYGTLFFGEFDYIDFVIKNSNLSMVMQSIYSLGLVYLFGFISYCIYLYRESTLKQMLFMVVVINFILIIKFLISYPSVCNTDFRYFVSSFPIIAFVLAQGFEHLFYHKIIKIIISILLILLFISELFFFYLLMYG